MEVNNLKWLSNWITEQSLRDKHKWNPSNGVIIHTLDNPGWRLWVKINETNLSKANFEKIKIDRTEHDWICCFIEDEMFQGYGGPFNLPEILSVFRYWAEANSQK